MKLSDRLKTIVDLVPNGDAVVDLGCDHGYVGRWLLKHKLSPRVQFVDQSQKVIQTLQPILREEGIDPTLAKVGRGEALNWENLSGTLVISGMGAHTIIQILESIPEVLRFRFHLILSANNRIQDLRRYLKQTDWRLTSAGDRLVAERGQFFQILPCRYKTGEELHLWGNHWPSSSQFASLYQADQLLRSSISQRMDSTLALEKLSLKELPCRQTHAIATLL